MFDRASELGAEAVFYTGITVWIIVGILGYIYYQLAQTAGYGMAAVYIIGYPVAGLAVCIVIAFAIMYTGYGVLLLLSLILGDNDE